MKVYVCDACGETIKEPHVVKMKEFCFDSDNDEHGVFPIHAVHKRKVHLCDVCYHALHLIGKKEEKQ